MRYLLLAAVLFSTSVFAQDWALKEARSLGTLTGGAMVWEKEAVKGDITTRLQIVTFSSKSLTLRVFDNTSEPPIRLSSAAEKAGAMAGINASYFHEDRRPLGLVVIDGQETHGFERAKLLAGVLAIHPHRIELVRSPEFQKSGDILDAVQAGPWLVDNGVPTVGLNDLKRARRTVVATDGRDNWALIATSPLTLADCAILLTQPGVIEGWKIKEALNLDGGSSTALWAATTPPLSIPEFGTVRNFLLLVPRQKAGR